MTVHFEATTTDDDGYPGVVETESYDDGFPDGAAGHHIAGERFSREGVVNTPTGGDYGFDGSDIVTDDRKHRNEEVGPQAANFRIHAATENARKSRKDRRPVTEASDRCNIGNLALQATNVAVRIVERNNDRKQITIGNPGATTLYVGRTSGIGTAPTPDVFYLPAGQYRTLTTRSELWVVGTAAGIVDWIEETYL